MTLFAVSLLEFCRKLAGSDASGSVMQFFLILSKLTLMPLYRVIRNAFAHHVNAQSSSLEVAAKALQFWLLALNPESDTIIRYLQECFWGKLKS